MWLSNYDLYDLHAVFIQFRFKPLYEKNREIAERIKALIDTPQVGNGIDHNNIRRELLKIEDLDKENWNWVFFENFYTFGTKVITDDIIFRILSDGLGELIKCFGTGDGDRIYCLADAMHNIPTIFVEEPDKKIIKIILAEIGYYRKKYDDRFLKDILNK